MTKIVNNHFISLDVSMYKSLRKNSKKKDVSKGLIRNLKKGESFKLVNIESILSAAIHYYKNTEFKLPQITCYTSESYNGIHSHYICIKGNTLKIFSIENFINDLYNYMYLLNGYKFECTLVEVHENIVIKQLINKYYSRGV